MTTINGSMFGKMKKIEAQLNYIIFKLEQVDNQIVQYLLKNEGTQSPTTKKNKFYDL